MRSINSSSKLVQRAVVVVLVLAILLLSFLFIKYVLTDYNRSSDAVKVTKLFHYQLQDARYEELKTLVVDYLIVDPDDAQLPATEITSLKNDGKTVLAYLSIGEAEDYRDYWEGSWQTGSPSFIDRENPEWPGNYKVKYWEPTWQDIILGKVENITSLGYSGVYLDIIDAYEYYHERGHVNAALDMINFVRLIKETGGNINADFLIVPQNAPELYDFAEYRELVDGLGKEDTWYNDNSSQDAEMTNQELKYLDQAVTDNKFVLAIDYPTGKNEICKFYRQCTEHNFYCSISNRDLDQVRPPVCLD
ncbi:endo alpha-1,4 polygalactosaminidase [Patescibacteria group bacterium]|nr:endo alpha-1,4 polygalactosaminidase [Patescibacteria group bacterium]